MRGRWVGAGVAVACTATLTAAVNPGAAAAGGLLFAPAGSASLASTASAAVSSDWAGWDVTGGVYTSVSATWTEPTVSCSTVPNSSSAFWVGLDGDTSTSVEQTGTEANCVDGVAQYQAWYEFYPSPSVNLTRVVKAGDTMSASVSYSKTGAYTLTIKDLTRGWTSTKRGVVEAGTNASAEVIAEAPTDSSTGAVTALADFGSATFTEATVNGKAIGTVSTPKRITMASDQDQALATASALSADDRFSVAWKASGADDQAASTTDPGVPGSSGWPGGADGSGSGPAGGYGWGTGGYGDGNGYGNGNGWAGGYGWTNGYGDTGYGYTGYGYGDTGYGY